MSHAHRSPKRFRPPKAWRSHQPEPKPATQESLIETFKLLYPDTSREHWTFEVPAWARLAHERHWMPWDRYRATWIKVLRPHPLKALYEASPFFRMIPKREPTPIAQTYAGIAGR